MRDEGTSTAETGSLWRRLWPVYGVSLPGLWPLAGHLGQIVNRIDPAQAAAGDASLLVAAGLAQTAILLLIAAGIGAALAHRIGLTSRLARRQGIRALVADLPPAIAIGALLGMAILALDRGLFMPWLSAHTAPLVAATGSREATLLLGLLYGGISEEVMMRWGLMTGICWAGMRLSRAPSAVLPARIAWPGILVAAFVFALAHLPATALAGTPDAPVVARVLVLNTMAGTVFGWLYWRRSLEAACVAHAMVHVCFYWAA